MAGESPAGVVNSESGAHGTPENGSLRSEINGTEKTLPDDFPEGLPTLGWPRPVIPLLPAAVGELEDPVVSLNGDWFFNASPPAGFWKDEVEPDDWPVVPVPGNLAVLLGMEVTAVEREEGVGWYPERDAETAYKRRIRVPESFDGKRIMLRFDSAFMFARVWVNGSLLRTHRGGFVPFYVDATGVAEPGETAWVTVGLTAEAPFAEYSHVRGMIADVSLVAMAPDYPSRLQAHIRFDEDYRDAELTVETGMIFHDAEEAEIVLRLTDPEGEPVPLPDNRIILSRRFPEASIKRAVSEPKHWTAETPYLYTLAADIKVDGRVTQTIERRIGFREVEVRGNKLYVNGKQVKLRGVNWHQAHPHLGIAVSREHDLESLRLLRDANVNLIRTSHWPQFEHILEAADEMGFYVLQESSVMFVGWPDRGEMLDDPQYLDSFMGQFASMIELSRSHPSVIIWSTGNESRWGENIRRTQEYAHAVDPERRPTIFSWGHQAPDDGYEIFSHHYPGLGETYSRHNVPVLFDEYAHPYTHSDDWIDYDPAFRDFYGESLRYFWDAIYRADGGLGGAIWHSRDKLFFREDGVWDGFLARWGVLDVWNRPKPEYYHVKAAHSPVRIKTRTLDPGGGTREVDIENRFHHTNLNRLRMYWGIDDSVREETGPDVEPMSKGVLRLPEVDWRPGQRVKVRFEAEEPDGRRRVVERHEFVVGRPVVAFETGGVPDLIREDGAFLIRGDAYELRIDRATGRIVEWARDGDPVVVGGPHLNLGYGGGLPGVPWPDPAAWRAEGVEAVRTDSAVELRVSGRYDEVAVDFLIEIDAAGVMEVSYMLTEAPSDYDAAGVAFDLAAGIDRMKWQRRGLWTVYPDDHVGRKRGVAFRERPAETAETFGHWPEHPWSWDEKDFHLYGPDDPGGRGTRDFRASRHYFILAGLYPGEGAIGIQAAGNGEGSAKATVNPDGTVRFDVNTDWSHPGFVGWGANPYHRNLHIPPGYANRVAVRLAAEDAAEPLVYVAPEELAATELAELSLEGGRLAAAGGENRQWRRGIAFERRPLLIAEARGPVTEIYVDGEKAGVGTAEFELPGVDDTRTFRIDLAAAERPIRRTHFLTLLRSDNLALERPVRASGELGSHPAARAVDGDRRTMWSASDTGEWSSVDADEWVIVDLEKPTPISRWVVVHAEGDPIYRTRDFSLEYSDEGPEGPWRTADEVRGNREAVTDRALGEPVEVRHFRLRVTKKSGEGAQWPAVRIRQLQLYR